MKHKAIVLAVIAATMSAQTAHAATAPEYSVHAQLPRGESMSAIVHVGDRARGPLLDVLNASNAVAQAGAAGKNTAQVALGPEHTCVILSVVTQGNTVTASGKANLPPPPPPRQERGPGGAPPPPERGADDAPNANVHIVVTLDGRQLRSARGNVSPTNGGRGHLEWALERVNH